MILLLFLLLFVVAVVGGVAAVGATLVVRHQRSASARANQVVPGVPSRAPAGWAGAHDPEARLHRRLRDAVAALRGPEASFDVAALELRVTLEQQALALDDALVAVAALPAGARPEPLGRIALAVEALEASAAGVVAALAADAAGGVEATLAEARQREATLDEIRAEIDRLRAASGGDGTAQPS